MHVPDGFFNAVVSLSTGVVAAAGVAVCLRGARRELDDRTAPMAGLVAAFVFAVQMLNFPVAAGTSGHLLGGALAAILVGPYTAVLCVAVVLLVQAFFFADGGLTALGVNITLMGVVAVLVGWGVFRLITLNVRGRGAVVAASFVAALLSVPATALTFTLLFWIGGTAPIEIGTVAAAMGGVHLLIGIGEGLITAVTVSTVLAIRPDLVYGARELVAPLILRGAGGDVTVTSESPASPAPVAARRPGWFLPAGIAVAALLAGLVSFYASSSPDGLERVAEDKGFSGQAVDHSLGEQPLADYGDVGGIPVGVAGLIGVGVTLAVGGGLFFTVRRRGESAEGGEDSDRKVSV
ncbi:energy-coupling factor ABC transporter permease [Streptosporangium sp. NBC_01755]|uniref:energy-coupling factor ABC transporter permease n=1 Tax=unclassified Streptosporangium TaxID=2632669 RepID=UPI002DDB0CD5|nr:MULTISPECIES: energy-coupling factor ABC transporter permease [unclassified Streptosporangium]WSA24519.1 energy-coupling factor ABC transporter permease [Streptosporangium sp. NBC_01810]WSC97407.1 energy-coupling factor ABC transporter permease [Streptosporangium sp. NBC_01755]